MLCNCALLPNMAQISNQVKRLSTILMWLSNYIVINDLIPI